MTCDQVWLSTFDGSYYSLPSGPPHFCVYLRVLNFFSDEIPGQRDSCLPCDAASPYQRPTIANLPSPFLCVLGSRFPPQTRVRSHHAHSCVLPFTRNTVLLSQLVVTKHAERARAFLQRSKRSPLRVNLVKNNHREFPLLPSHLVRLVSLEMCDCASQKEPALSQPMPALRRLKIAHIPSCDEDDEVEERETSPSWSLISVTSLIIDGVRFTQSAFPTLPVSSFKTEMKNS